MEEKPKGNDEKLEDLYAVLFDSDVGRQVLKDLKSRFYVNGTTFDTDHSIMASREGQRSVVNYIVNRTNRLMTNRLSELKEKLNGKS